MPTRSRAGVALQLLAQIYHPTGPSQCHDITVYPAMGLAGGACSGYGLLLNIKDPVHPVRLEAVSDSNFVVLALGDVQQRRARS